MGNGRRGQWDKGRSLETASFFLWAPGSPVPKQTPSAWQLSWGCRWEPQLGLWQVQTAAWMWMSAPQGPASTEATARTCPTASSATA